MTTRAKLCTRRSLTNGWRPWRLPAAVLSESVPRRTAPLPQPQLAPDDAKPQTGRTTRRVLGESHQRLQDDRGRPESPHISPQGARIANDPQSTHRATSCNKLAHAVAHTDGSNDHSHLGERLVAQLHGVFGCGFQRDVAVRDAACRVFLRPQSQDALLPARHMPADLPQLQASRNADDITLVRQESVAVCNPRRLTHDSPYPAQPCRSAVADNGRTTELTPRLRSCNSPTTWQCGPKHSDMLRSRTSGDASSTPSEQGVALAIMSDTARQKLGSIKRTRCEPEVPQVGRRDPLPAQAYHTKQASNEAKLPR